jgi:thioesterase domain-containing protein
VVSDILRDRTAGKIGTLILIGHSQGGNDSIEIARGLEVSRVPVDLLVTFDPYRQKPVPANVARAINYYQHGGWGLALVPEAGFRGRLVNNDLAADMTISHFNIADNDDIHADVLREVDALLQANTQANAQTIPLPKRRKHSVGAAGSDGQAASFAAIGFQFQGRS